MHNLKQIYVYTKIYGRFINIYTKYEHKYSHIHIVCIGGPPVCVQRAVWYKINKSERKKNEDTTSTWQSRISFARIQSHRWFAYFGAFRLEHIEREKKKTPIHIYRKRVFIHYAQIQAHKHTGMNKADFSTNERCTKNNTENYLEI